MASFSQMRSRAATPNIDVSQFPSNPFAAPQQRDEDRKRRQPRQPQKPQKSPEGSPGPDVKIPTPIFAPVPIPRSSPVPNPSPPYNPGSPNAADILSVFPGGGGGINPNPPAPSINLPSSPVPINPSPTMGGSNLNIDTGGPGINLPGSPGIVNPNFAPSGPSNPFWGQGGNWMNILRELRARSMQPQPPIFNPNVTVAG